LARATPGGGAGGEDYATIASALEASGAVRGWLQSLPESLHRLHQFTERIHSFEGEVKAIRAVVGPDGEVLDSASTKLADIRRDITLTTQKIHDIIHGYVRNPDIARLLQSTNVTLHGERYVLPVRAENRGRLPGVVHRASNTGATLFIEPTASVELNNRLVDLLEDQRREIRRLLNELAIRLRPRREQIDLSMRALGQIDLVAAKAQYAYQFDMTCPEVTAEGPLRLTQARHPLLIDQAWSAEKNGVPADQRQPVVPIDLRLGEDFDILVITGSNTGGKTVALKTAALLSAMAQAGMHLPAQRGATVPIFHDIFIDVGDEQSLEQSLSTFGGHVQRLKGILEQVDKRSLVLLDELGSGTDPDEGGAIGQAVLDHLQTIGCSAMVTTHLSVLKAYAFNHDRVDNASVEFDTQTLRPTYRLHIGTPGESNAITVARRLGLPKSITDAAYRHLPGQHQQFRKAMRQTTAARKDAEQARKDAEAAEIEALSRQESLDARMASLHEVREEFETWLATLPSLQPGDEVTVPSLGRAGTLVRLELHRQLALVEVDGKQVEVPLSKLMPDFGQGETARQIAGLRRQIEEQAQQGKAALETARRARAEAEDLKAQAARDLKVQQAAARRFDAWIGQIARLSPGDEVPIARKPGKGTVVSVDLPGLRATVKAGGKTLVLSLQELFPQTGPFAPHRRDPRSGQGKGKGRSGSSRQSQAKGGRSAGRPGATKSAKPDPPKPMRRGPEGGKKADKIRRAVLSAEPGQEVYVVPFNKRARLVRVDEEKDQATVQSGAFEMQVRLADVQLVD
jgi:DNA mismatch repair protein MutS2